MDLTDRPADAAAPHQLPPQERAGDELLARALRRARWTIFWERLWPALASLATVIGLFLAVSWLGLWLWLPPAGRAIGLGVFFLLTAAAFAPVLMLRVPCRIGPPPRSQTRSPPPLKILIRLRCGVPISNALYARPRRSGPGLRCRGSRCATPSPCAPWWRCWWSRRSSPPAANG